MSRREYNLLAGIVLIAASVIFLIVPALLDYEPFVPLMLALFSLMTAIVFLVNGAGGD